MTKLFRNSKQVLSFALAFAVLAVSLFTGVVINSQAASCDGVVEVWGDTKSTLTGAATTHLGGEPKWYDDTFSGSGSPTDPYIIDSAEGLAWLATKATAAETTGKYYKVADGIKAFNMNTVVDMSGDMTAAEVEAALNTVCQMKTWWAGNFAGSFDGNGITIYGVQGNNTQHGGSGSLFGKAVAAGATFKNFELKNSYFKGDRAGSIFDNASGAGTITVENVVLTGNVLVSTRSNSAESYGGVMFARAGSNRVDVKNCLVYGNIAKHQGFYGDKTGYDVTYGMMGNSSKVDNVASRIENTIILDCLPYTAMYSYSSTAQMEFSNVYTNMLDVEVTNTMREGSTEASSYTTTYTGGIISQDDGKYKIVVKLGNKDNSGTTTDLSGTVGAGSFYAVTADGIKGSAGQALMSGLDWKNTWFATEDGPQLRKFHNLTAVTPSAEGHGYECADCDIDAVVAHIWDGNTCTECGYTCNHTSQTVTKTDAATCVSKEIVYSTCNNCKQELTEQVGAEPTGHVVTYVEADPADCTNTGIYGYWHCSVCDGNFLAETEEEAKWAAMDSSYANPETDLIMPADPVGGHSQKTDADGVIVIVDGANGHYYECSVCDGKLNHKSEEIAEDEVVKHDFSASVCKECGWACTEHDYQLTGNILVVGDCYTDHEDELKCTICSKQESKVTKASHNIVAVAEVKATDKMEGTKAHYQCTECKSIYADAEGKTSVTKASLVIPKQLPAGYENTYEGTGGTTAPENADTSTTSPATSDGIIVVAAAVALMGAAFVIFRKARKA